MYKFIILLSLFSFLSQHTAAQKPDLKFKHLTGSNGLSQTHAIHLAQDHKGFIWIGTQNGLNKFDGYDISYYNYNPDDSTSISSNHIRYIFEDSNNKLWLGTAEGLNLYDRENDRFIRFTIPDYLQTNSYQNINVIYEDKLGDIWIGTSDGVYIFNPEDSVISNYKHNPNDQNSLSHNSVFAFCEDDKGNLWIGTADKLNLLNREDQTFRHFEQQPDGKGLSENNIASIIFTSKGQLWLGTRGGGINVFDYESETFHHYRHDPQKETSISNDEIFYLMEDRQGNIWIGTENGGLNLFDEKSNSFSHYVHDIYDPQSILNNSVPVILQDVSGTLWVGTHNGGVSYGHPYQSNFSQYRKEFQRNSLSHNNVKAFLEDHEGNIWIGTDGGGLNLWNRKKNNFVHYRHKPNEDGIGSDVIISLLEDEEKNLWIGTYGGGLTLFDRKNNSFTHYRADPNDPETLSGNTIWDIMADANGDLWLATRDRGICKFDRKANKFIRYAEDPDDVNSLSNMWTICVFMDSKDNIWIGTYGALNLLDAKTGTFRRFWNDNNDPGSISHNQINNIFEDTKGNLWIATPNGLNLYDEVSNSFTVFTQKDGLPSDLIQSIEEDDHGNLWISTLNHIVKFNPDTKLFKNYLAKYGTFNNEFLQNVSLKTSNGEIIFGGLNGFNIFHPDSIKENNFIPPVYFTDFQIFNKNVPIGENSPLKRNINEVEHITLTHKESVFSFEFAALNYINSEKNQYAYFMEGFDKEWIYSGARRTATYTNLDPGEYVFRVKASNNDGVWNEEGASVIITIVPPFWNTWWFRIFFVLLITGSAFYWYTSRINDIKKQKEVVEAQVKERTAEVVAQKEKLAHQTEHLQNANLELERVHNEMKASIRAAQLIQKSILPSIDIIEKYWPEHFILYKPKDVVSGDFYWFGVVKDQTIIAAVDCTGHGVAGAFMSINGHHLLNNAVYPYDELVASEILERLNSSLIKELHQEHSPYEISDGMDIALCIIDSKKRKLQYAGANIPLYILRDRKIIQIEANRKPIGLSMRKQANTNFKNKIVDLHKNDILYLFSDGYADQTGGEEGIKFMYPQFRELLKEISNKEMDQQLTILDKTLEKWKAGEEQLDDILVMGFKVT